MPKEERDASGGWEEECEFVGVSPFFSGKKRPPMPKNFQYDLRAPIPNKSFDFQTLYHACLNMRPSSITDESVINAKNTFFEKEKEQLTDLLDNIKIKDGIIHSLLDVFVKTHQVIYGPYPEQLETYLTEMDAAVGNLSRTSGQDFKSYAPIYKYFKLVAEYLCKSIAGSTTLKVRRNLMKDEYKGKAQSILYAKMHNHTQDDGRSEKDDMFYRG